jgi:uncharacterized membrane protein YhiD involved in acid resistance
MGDYRCFQGYFTQLTFAKGAFYLLMFIYVLTATVIMVMQPFLVLNCSVSENYEKREFENVSYVDDPCRHTRLPQLLYLTVTECSFGRRIVSAMILGGVIGWERREADRPAGIRTMALVSLGSCLFTICSAFAFLDGPMAWDASRVSAAIPSGVGFLGAGLIFKQESKDHGTGESNHSVHGLTTAASLWLCAAIGIACGGELYFPATFCVSCSLLMLRFGPRFYEDDELREPDEHSLDDLEAQYIPQDFHAIRECDSVDSEAKSLIRRYPTDGTIGSKNSRTTPRKPRPQLI